jgi:lipopolysaccharide/colanic/teichoic acid biosynthesis glycosyltransferase
MIDWLLSLWEKNKILFFILIIPVILAVAIKIYQEIIYSQAKSSLKKADKKSNEIKQKVASQEKKAKEHIDNAKAAEDRINKRNQQKDSNLNWHKDEE